MKIKIILSLFLFLCTPYATCEEPIQLNTETEDIALTDDINTARAQVAKYPNNAEAHFNLAIALSRTSLVEEAIKELRKTKLLIRKPENSGIIDKKVSEYKEMLKNNPEAGNIKYRLAFSHYLKAYLTAKNLEKTKNNLKGKKAGKDKKSLDIFDPKRLLLIDKNPEIKENLELSMSYFKDLIKSNPDDLWAKVYYAFILVEQYGDTEKARHLWNEVEKQNPNNPAPYLFLGELHIKEGRLKEGILEISRALLLRSQGY